jgi:hypothetical protein
MTPLEEFAEELRDVKKQLAGQRLRMNQMMMVGTVKSVAGSRAVVTLADDGDEGEVNTPALRMAAHTGKRGSGVSEMTKLGVGEPVLVISPGGEVNGASAVMPWSDSQDDPSPGTAEQDGKIIEIGSAKLEIRDGFAKLAVGGLSITLEGDTITITGKTQINGAALRHNAKSISDTHTHTGITPGPANTGAPT